MGVALELRVWDAYSRDVGKGVGRIAYSSMDKLGASDGDVLEIKGAHRTVVKCLPLYPSDEGKGAGIIKIDGLGRSNAGIDVGDTISVRKIKSVPAEKIVVAPLEGMPPIDERYLADALEGIPLIKDDYVMVPYFGGQLTFKIIGVTPASDATIVTKKTKFQIGVSGHAAKDWSEEDDASIKRMRPDFDKPYPQDTHRHIAFALEEMAFQISRIADALGSSNEPKRSTQG